MKTDYTSFFYRCTQVPIGLVLMAVLLLSCNSQSVAPALGAETVHEISTGSQRVPAGTSLKVVFQTPLDAKTSNPGEIFLAKLGDDFYTGQALILPKGAILRGRVSNVKRPGLFSQGGALDLAFDHVMLPSGELLPLTLQLSANNAQTRVQKGKAPHSNLANATVDTSLAAVGDSQKRVLYADPGVGKKVQQGAKEAGNLFERINHAGFEAGKKTAGGFGTIVTVPASIIGGGVAAAGVTTGKTAVALVGRGETVKILPGDVLNIDFGDAFALPVQQ